MKFNPLSKENFEVYSTFFLLWVFEVVGLVKSKQNCSGVLENPVSELLVADSGFSVHVVFC